MPVILEDANLEDKDLRIISNLYWNQTVCMRLDGEQTEQVKILGVLEKDLKRNP